jgi:phosphatidylglycerophosphatase A
MIISPPRRTAAALIIALGFGLGRSPWAPGTVGSIGAFVLFKAVEGRFEPLALVLSLVIAFVLGVWACDIAGRALGAHDHGAMVWDEVVACFAVLLLLPADWRWQLAGVVLFRVFDISKPPPIRMLEKRFRNGFGVMLDDLVAAFATLIVLALIKRLFW